MLGCLQQLDSRLICPPNAAWPKRNGVLRRTNQSLDRALMSKWWWFGLDLPQFLASGWRSSLSPLLVFAIDILPDESTVSHWASSER
jgi:hypothetical protein